MGFPAVKASRIGCKDNTKESGMNGLKRGESAFIFSYARACAYGRPAILLGLLAVSTFAVAGSSVEDSLNALSDQFKTSDTAGRFQTIEKISAIKTPEAAELLARYAKTEKDANLRLAALDAISAINVPTVVPSLAPLLSDRLPAVRQRVARVVGILHAPPSETLLLAATQKESDPAVRAALIQALVLCGGSASDSLLQQAASDRDPAVRSIATEGVARRTHPRVKAKVKP